MTVLASEHGRGVVHEVIQPGRLKSVTRRPPLGEYVAQLSARRHFVLADARGRVISGTRGTYLGTLWLILQPLLDGAVYYVIFGLLLGVSRGIDNFVGYLLIGVFLFHYTSRSLNRGAQSLIGGRNLIKAFAFPRAALPLATVAREAIALLPVIGVLLVLVLALPPTEAVTWRWLLLPLVLVLQSGFNLGLALIAARATARIPDLQHVIGFGIRFWLYGSAVFFSYDQFVDHPTLLRVLELNPMFVVLDMARDLLLYATLPDIGSWAVLLGWTVIVLGGGFVFFWRGEESYGGA
ncbi:ABC transporter permease [Cellulomonas fimi]|uniref:Transport permease protein n=1 Tax=Cellulomonas fimi TaxID=1708 RepID=A0A7Y0LZ33_CELFI|nr:ABC transporter permease [Cellulomonas fimi]NMR20524.1 ABC transporter permease [Cellulomonas fimi]